MHKVSHPLVIFLTLLCSSFTYLIIQNWVLGETYSVKFINPEASGTFTRMTADISFSETDLPDSKFDVQIDVNSLDMGSPEMSKEALSPDMLNARRFSKIQFLSANISKTDRGFLAKGSLELHGIKKDIEIPFTFLSKTFAGSFDIKAKDYGINSLGNGAEDILRIELSVPVKEK